MNVLKNVIRVVALFALTFSASAIEVSFDFSVFSSGSSIYPCNAGIKHANTNEVICYKRTEPTTTCNPSACIEGEQCDCVCTGTVGRSKVDFLSAEYTNWKDHNESVGSSSSVKFKANNKKNFIFKNENDNKTPAKGSYFKKQLTSLSFDLGSETFGAKYFLDVCFRGPQIDYATAGINTSWTATSQATVQNIADYAAYAATAGLNVSSEIVCDYQQAGEPNDVNFVPNRNTFEREASFDMIDDASFKFTDLASSGDIAIDDSNIAPTFCRVRYTFSEGNDLQGRELFRPWKKQAAKICTKTSVEQK